jgi:hypothetical protein
MLKRVDLNGFHVRKGAQEIDFLYFTGKKVEEILLKMDVWSRFQEKIFDE